MGKTITFSKVEVNSIHIEKLSEGYTCNVMYNLQDSDGSVSLQGVSRKCTSEVPGADPSESLENPEPKLSVGSDALVMNFVNSITTLMGDREEL